MNQAMSTLHLHRRAIYTVLSSLIVLLFIVLFIQNESIKSRTSIRNELSYSNDKKYVLDKEHKIGEKQSNNYEIYSLKKEWFLDNCLSNFDKNNLKFEEIEDYVQKFQESDKENCRFIYKIFNSMFELDISYGEIRIDDKFLDKVKVWLNNNPDYISQAYKQKIIKIYNKYYNDEMIYNPLRGKRPQSKQTVSEKNYSLDILRESKNGCDFCQESYKINTANEIFDRLETSLSYSAANTFKYDKWHSLIVSRNHDTLFLNEEEIIDLYSLSLKWFEKVNSIDSKAVYPELIWDAMPKSGASQIHTHLQVSMDEKSYYGVMRRWLKASTQYFNENKRDFLDDFILIHKALGLVYEVNNCFVIFTLIPLKDNEVMIIGNDDPESYLTISKLTHRVIRIFVDKIEQYSFSTGMYFPIFGEKKTSYDPSKLEKIYSKILFRSPVANLRSDFNGLDLFTSSVIGVDRYILANRVFTELEKYQ
ncbi:unnamed protein product [Brachionus calyciflorus]|uniref:Galactose-1-phosphate uridylyltransferase n=1 Tax=Brachionus calyciflorus TaxID=104777 RepID=A0A813M565_9BILA|nr:unnamed protein product [Brachionus calyciflorus]